MTDASDLPWQTSADGIVLTVRLVPNAGRDRIEGIARLADGSPVLKVRVAAVPEKGAANHALTRLLARTLGVPAGAVTMVSGETKRLKRLAIAGPAAPVLQRLQALAQDGASDGRVGATAAIAVALTSSCASAAEFQSAYTSLDLDQCQLETAAPDAEEGVDGGVFWCAGYDDTPVRVADGDLRYFVSYGANADTEPAANQTRPGFNTIHTTLEWRLVRTAPDAPWQPFATILRYFESSGPTGEVQTPILVVTRLGNAGEICHVGYVAVRGNPDANVMAQAVADTIAPTFRCNVDNVETYGPDNRP